MCTNMKYVVEKLPVEVLRGGILPLMTINELIRLSMAVTKRDGSSMDEIRDCIHNSLSDNSAELVIASKQAISWFQRANIHLSTIRFGCGVSRELLELCPPTQHARALSFNGCTKLSSADIAAFLTPFMHLERLDLTLCQVQPDLLACISRMTNLTTLNLSLVMTIKYSELRTILTNCPKLRDLNMYGVTHLSWPTGMSRLAPLCSMLTALNLSHIYLEPSAIHEVCRFASSLQELNLRASGPINHTAMASMAEHCTNLQKLDISYLSRGGVSDSAIRALSSGCKRLVEFKANGHTRVSYVSLVPLVRECTLLQVLELAETSATDEVLLGIAKHCSHLKHLNISSCQVTDIGVCAVGARCTTLTCLLLEQCNRVSDESVTLLARNCRKLQELSLKHCAGISDVSLVELAQHCGALQVLDISVCQFVGNTGITAIARGCRDLRRLCMRHCTRITDESIVELFLHCSKLRAVQAFGCGVSTNTMSICGL